MTKIQNFYFFVVFLFIFLKVVYSFNGNSTTSQFKNVVKNGKLKIAWGSEADMKEFSHQIAFWCGTSVICGGTIIDKDWVLTAAHCLDDCYSNFGIIAGNADISKSSGQVISAEKKIVHELWDPTSPDAKYDIALLKLSKSLTFSDSVKRAFVQTKEYGSGQMVWVSGWGKMETGSFPNILRKVEVPVVSYINCLQFGSVDDQSMICAGDGSGKDSCSGDSGGPLGAFDANGDFVIGGIVSWGPSDCGAKGSRGIYTKVSHYKDWISQYAPIIAGGEKFYPSSILFFLILFLIV